MTTFNTISVDMKIEILLKLPVKSVLRLKSVSKSWASVIRSQQFIDAFMSVSLTRPPRLVLALNDTHEDRLFFFSSPHQNCSFLSFLELPRFKPHINYICNSVRGFICCRVGEDGDKFVVCNPTTGQVIPLGGQNSDYYHWHHMFLGYDPNSDQYKVLSLMFPKELGSHVKHSVCTLGGQRSSYSWSPIKASIPYYYFCYRNSVCIDGVVYYKCLKIRNGTMVICFDVGSEQLRHIEIPENLYEGDITNYLGKLAMCCSTFNGCILWVLDDAKNQFWSKKTYDYGFSFSFERITASGEIVYGPQLVSDSLELLCYNMETKMGRSIRVTGLSDYINWSTLKSSPFYSSLLCSYVDNIIHL